MQKSILSDLRIHARGRESDTLASGYLYDVEREGCLVAEIWHDFRGDEHLLRLPCGPWMQTERILTGGGPEALRLNAEGEAELSRLLSRL